MFNAFVFFLLVNHTPGFMPQATQFHHLQQRTSLVAKLSYLNHKPTRNPSPLNAISSFNGEVWLGKYDSIMSSPYNEHSAFLLFLERLFANGLMNNKNIREALISIIEASDEISLDFKSLLKKEILCVDEQNPDADHELAPESETLVDGAAASKPRQKENREEERQKQQEELYVNETKRFLKFPEGRYDDEIPAHVKMGSDPRSFWKRQSIKEFIEDRSFTLNKLKLLRQIASNDYSFDRQIKRYFLDDDISEKLLSEEYLPYFINLFEYSVGKKETLEKVTVKTAAGPVVSISECFGNQDKRIAALESFLSADKDQDYGKRLEALKFALSNDYKDGQALNASDVFKLVKKQGHFESFFIGEQDFIDLQDLLKAYENPLEIAIVVGLLFSVPQEALFKFLQSFGLNEEQCNDYTWFAAKLSRYNKSEISWVLKSLEYGKIFAPAFLLKNELLTAGSPGEFIGKYWDLFSDKNGFAVLQEIIVEHAKNLEDSRRDDFINKIIEFVPMYAGSADEKSSLVEELKRLEFDITTDQIDDIYQVIIDLIQEETFNQRLIDYHLDTLILKLDFNRLDDLMEISKKILGEKFPKKPVKMAEFLKHKMVGPTVEIEGIELPVKENSFDKDLIPSKESADLVLTPTAKRMLKNLAVQWRSRDLQGKRNKGGAALLEGPTSAGKTSYVKYIAAQTNSPFRRINFSYNTEVQDLLGRWVAGEERFTKTELSTFSFEHLKITAKSMGLEQVEYEKKSDLVDAVYAWQKEPHWEDGPVTLAVRRGEVLCLDEINLARPQVIEAMNSIFDEGKLTLEDNRGEVLYMHPDTRIFATMNPESYVGRQSMSDAFKSRNTRIWVEGAKISDIIQIIQEMYPDVLPEQELAKLVASHASLAELADQGYLGRSLGGTAYTLRNLFRVVERFKFFQGDSPLTDSELLRREFEEVYLGAIIDAEEVKIINDILLLNMPVASTNFYDHLEFSIDEDGFTIGDVKVKSYPGSDHGLIPERDALEIVMTRRSKEVFYKMVKALELGEHVALVGERASGKTILAEYYAALKGQPFYRQVFSEKTSNMDLIGMYTPSGWQDGLLLRAGRPGNVPGVFLADEFNQANDAVQERLNSLLDKDRKLFLSEKGGGEEVVFAEDFRFISAFNPPKRQYGGRRQLSQASKNRITVQSVPDLKDKEEFLEIFETIGAKRGVPRRVTTALVDLHFWVLEQLEQNHLGEQMLTKNHVFSVRQLKSAFHGILKLAGDQGGFRQGFLLAVELNYEAAFAKEEDRLKIREKARELSL